MLERGGCGVGVGVGVGGCGWVLVGVGGCGCGCGWVWARYGRRMLARAGGSFASSNNEVFITTFTDKPFHKCNNRDSTDTADDQL